MTAERLIPIRRATASAYGFNKTLAPNRPELKVIINPAQVWKSLAREWYDHARCQFKEIPMTENRCDRPWGSFFVLVDQENTKVKKLVCNPGHRLSYQSHKLRDEHWVVVQGEATVTLDDVTKKYHYGDHIFIKRGTKHRLACEGIEPVEIIEVQTGEDFPEEDIVRYSDDYQRAGTTG